LSPDAAMMIMPLSTAAFAAALNASAAARPQVCSSAPQVMQQTSQLSAVAATRPAVRSRVQYTTMVAGLFVATA
jgi:hypothetical protein